jgi:hypothetical protein
MLLRDFMPPSDSGLCTYVVQTVHGSSPATWPESKIPFDAGVVVLGRPAVFGAKAEGFFRQCLPSSGYGFESGDPGTNERYRTIRVDDARSQHICCPSFTTQKGAYLYDYGLVYSGWQTPAEEKPRPVMLLAGTSTLGTWGAVKYATEVVPPDDVRWYDDVQGIVRAEALNSPEAFEDVEVKHLQKEMLSPCRIWMEGGDLPASSKDAWTKAHVEAPRRPKGRPLDLRMYVNGTEVMPKLGTYIPPLVLLALASGKTLSRFPGGSTCEATAYRISEAVRSFLGVSRLVWDAGPKQRVWMTLEPLINQIRRAGGIASVRRAAGQGDTKAFTLTARPLPFLLPRVP